MIVGADTDMLVNWLMDGAPHHAIARQFIRETFGVNDQLGVTSQTMHELIHICTDRRRFEVPLSMEEALRYSRTIWDGEGVVRLMPSASVFHRTLDLMSALKLGRKRILDTALAATLEAAGVERLATFNAEDFKIFEFLEVVVPETDSLERHPS